ncbi:MAG: hypothetical protein GC189_01155 [Alphaproteobacteria bacterium]|nr:hypothetical protein [Alphaproteobacteria bacterium]
MPVPTDVFETAEPVPYDQLRGQIQNGDILLCNGTAMFSRLIQKATRCPWSHVGFIVKLDAIDRVMVVESVDGAGVRTQALSILVNGNDKRIKPYPGRLAIARHDDFAAMVTNERLRLASQYAVDRFAAPYGMVQITKIATRIALARLGVRLPRLRANGEYICSEYAAECYAAIGLAIQPSKLGFVAPGDFAADPKVNLVGVMRVPTLEEARELARARARVAREAERAKLKASKAAERQAAKDARADAKADRRRNREDA